MPGVSLGPRIFAPRLEWSLMVEAATLQWGSGQTSGLAFFFSRSSWVRTLLARPLGIDTATRSGLKIENPVNIKYPHEDVAKEK